MLNEFFIVMDSKIGNLIFTNCYLGDILVASKGGFTKHKNIVHKILSILDNLFLPSNNQNVNSSEKIGCLGFNISKSGIAPLIDKTKALKDISIPKNLKEICSFFGSTNQYINFVPKLASLGSPLRLLINKKSTFLWNKERTKTFEKIKWEIVNLTENTHFVVKRNTKVKTDASHIGVDASLEQLQGNNWKTVSFASRFLSQHKSKFHKWIGTFGSRLGCRTL